MKLLILFLFLGCFACKNTIKKNTENEKTEALHGLAADSSKWKTRNEKENTETSNEREFDLAKWKTKDKNDYPYREEMYKEVLYSDSFRRLKKEAVLDMLGMPDKVDSLYLFYLVAQKRIGFFPLNSKTLVIKLSDDGSVEWVKIHE
ncbi:MAG: hypothetical protein ABIQ02_10995 [Saprospiraceae bacterium]